MMLQNKGTMSIFLIPFRLIKVPLVCRNRLLRRSLLTIFCHVKFVRKGGILPITNGSLALAQELIWVQALMRELGFEIKTPTLWCDKKGLYVWLPI